MKVQATWAPSEATGNPFLLKETKGVVSTTHQNNNLSQLGKNPPKQVQHWALVTNLDLFWHCKIPKPRQLVHSHFWGTTIPESLQQHDKVNRLKPYLYSILPILWATSRVSSMHIYIYIYIYMLESFYFVHLLAFRELFVWPRRKLLVVHLLGAIFAL